MAKTPDVSGGQARPMTPEMARAFLATSTPATPDARTRRLAVGGTASPARPNGQTENQAKKQFLENDMCG